MKARVLLNAALVAVLAVPGAGNADQVRVRQFTTKDVGGTCSDWLSAAHAGGNRRKTQEAYVLGFASALSLFWDPKLGLEHKATSDDVLRAVDEACAAHPQGDVSATTTEVMHRFIESAATQATPAR